VSPKHEVVGSNPTPPAYEIFRKKIKNVLFMKGGDVYVM
jgi:hypothetical protein